MAGYDDFATADTSAPAASSPLTSQQAKTAWDNGSAQLERMLASQPGLSEADKSRKRDAFFNDPRIARLRIASAAPASAQTNATAGPPAPVPVTTKRAEIQKVARQSVQERQQAAGMDDGAGNFLTALKGGINQGVNAATMGLPNVVAAGLEKVLPSSITGNNTDASYMDILRSLQEKNAAEGERNMAGNFLGNIMGAAPIAAAALPVAASAAPAALTDAVTSATAASPRIAAIAKTVAGGVAGGATGALANGQDPAEGAAVGAVAAPTLGLGAKGLGWAGKKAANVLGLPKAAGILKSLTTATVDQITERINQLRAQGIEPTLFEVLPLADRNRISKNLVGRSDATLEGTQRLVSERLGNIGPEMANRVNTAAAPARAAATQDMTDAMTAARGTPDAPVPEMPGDAAVAARATRDPIALAAQPNAQARAIMAPHDNQTLFNDIDEMLPPPHPELQDNGEVHDVPGDPAVAAMIRRKARILQRKNSNEVSGGITGRNVSDLLGELNDYANGPNVDADVARSAVQHIEDTLDQTHPEFLTAHARMNDAFAASKRIGEGSSEGMNTRTRAQIDPTGVNQPVRNAYGTDEGATGRALGQANQLETSFGQAGPRKAISQAAGLPNQQAAIAQNLGPDAAGQIAETAASQTQGAQALAGLDRQTKTSPTTLGPDDLAAAALGLNPASMIRTKIAAIQKLTQAIGIPEAKARGLVELLFSTDPAKRGQVLNMLNQTAQGKSILSSVATSFNIGAAAGTSGSVPAVPEQPMEPNVVPPAADATGEPDPYADLGTEDATPADPATQEPAADPTQAPAPAAPAMDTSSLSAGASPEMQELLRQIAATGAAPGQEQTPRGRAVIEGLFPGAHITEDVRDPNSKLGKSNPNSYHVRTDEAVDVRPIPGMSFEDFIAKIEAAGHRIIEKRDEVKHPVSYATGPHWHVVIA